MAIPELAQVGFALPLFIQVQDKDEVSPCYTQVTVIHSILGKSASRLSEGDVRKDKDQW